MYKIICFSFIFFSQLALGESFDGRWSAHAISCLKNKNDEIKALDAALKEKKEVKMDLEFKAKKIKQTLLQNAPGSTFTKNTPLCIINLEGEIFRKDGTSFEVRFDNFSCSDSCAKACEESDLIKQSLKETRKYYYTLNKKELKLQRKLSGYKKDQKNLTFHKCGLNDYEVIEYKQLK